MFSKCFEYHLYNFEEYLSSKFLFNLTLFTLELLPPYPLKWTQLSHEPKQ